MKKVLVLLLVFALVFCTFVQAAAPEKDAKVDKKLLQTEKLNKMVEISHSKGKALKVEWNEKNGTPSFITGALSENAVTNESSVVAFMENNKDLFGVKAGNFKVEKVEADKLNTKHYKTVQTVDGIPVYGTEMIVHTDADGIVYAVNGQADADVTSKSWNKEFKNEKGALAAAMDYVGLDKKASVETAVKPYIYNVNKEWQPVYLVTLKYLAEKPGNWSIFVNASTNKVVKAYNAVDYTATTGTGVDTHGVTRPLNLDLVSGKYYMRDLTRNIETYNMNYSSNEYGLPGTLIYDTDNNFNSSVQAAAVDSAYFLGITRDYYLNVLNRNSYNNAGATIKGCVHFGSNYNNAFWWNGFMVFGDGDGVQFAPLSGALDVIAHEFTHAVTENTCNLEYESQSGALNESMSDVFGYLIEGVASDWQMGEDVTTPGTAGDALRDLQNPTLYGQPAHMNDYMNLPVTEAGDWGGVHYNSGIPNKAFYNIATVINNNTKMANIYYRAMTTYLTQYAQFVDARSAILQATADLYGAGGTEYTAVENGFTAVGIGGSSGSDTYEPNGTMTAAYGPLTSGTEYSSYIYSNGDVDYYYFNTTTTGTITINLTNLPKDYDVYLYNSSGTQLGKSENGSTTNETISYSASTTGKFYVKVVGYNGAYSTSQAYKLKATYPTGGGGAQWYYQNVSVDTPHNYSNNYNNTYTYTKTGAQQVSVYFSQFATESGYDYVYIKDKNNNTVATYHGSLSPFWATVTGDTIKVNIVTDSSVTAYGYHISQTAYYSTTPLIVPEGVTVEDVVSTPELLVPEEVK